MRTRGLCRTEPFCTRKRRVRPHPCPGLAPISLAQRLSLPRDMDPGGPLSLALSLRILSPEQHSALAAKVASGVCSEEAAVEPFRACMHRHILRHTTFSEDADVACPGCSVELVDLETNADHNGDFGTVTGQQIDEEGEERIAVRIMRDGQTETVLVLPWNLRRVQDRAGALGSGNGCGGVGRKLS